MKPWRSKTYRDSGKGQPCVFGCGREAAEGAHIRLAGFCGTSQKPPDFMLADACHTCHLEYGNMNRETDAVDVLRALCWTLQRRFSDNVIGVL